MTVTEYDRALCELTRYEPELVDTDAKMVEKFRAGLNHDIRAPVASRRGITCSEVLSYALDVEEALPKDRTIVKTTSPPPPHQQNFRDKRNWEGDRAPYDNKRQQYMRNPPQYGGRQNAPYQRSDFRPRVPHCVNCLKNHFGVCRKETNKCYTCGGNGHFLESARIGMWGWEQGIIIKGSVRNRGHYKSRRGDIYPPRSSSSNNNNVVKDFPLKQGHML